MTIEEIIRHFNNHHTDILARARRREDVYSQFAAACQSYQQDATDNNARWVTSAYEDYMAAVSAIGKAG